MVVVRRKSDGMYLRRGRYGCKRWDENIAMARVFSRPSDAKQCYLFQQWEVIPGTYRTQHIWKKPEDIGMVIVEIKPVIVGV